MRDEESTKRLTPLLAPPQRIQNTGAKMSTRPFYQEARPSNNAAYMEFYNALYNGLTGCAVMSEKDWKAEGSPTSAQWRSQFKDRVIVKTDDEGKEIVKVAREPRVPRSNVVVPKASGSRRLPQMFAEGVIKVGQVLHIVSKENSDATVIDGKTVKFGNTPMTFNKWGETVTGHVAVNIYIHAQTSDNVFLNALR